MSILIVLATLMAPLVWGFTENDYVRLYDDLLVDYKKHIRPIDNQSSPVTIQFDIMLLSIGSVDHVTQQMSIQALVTLTWTDERLMWTPSDYGGIDRLHLTPDQIWAPNMYLANSFNNAASINDLRTQHLVQPSGSVTYGSSGTIHTSCNLDMTYFPFDSHTCSISISDLDSTLQDLVIEPGFRGATLSPQYPEHEEWITQDILLTNNLYGAPGTEFSSASFDLTIERRPAYYLLNVITPVVSLAVLSLMSFAVPADSGERLSYVLATLLSLSVYIPYIGDIMPKSSLNMPVLLRYLVSLFLTNVVCVLFTVIVMTVRCSCTVSKGQQKIILIFGIPFLLRDGRRSRSCFRFWRRQARIDDVGNSAIPNHANGDSSTSRSLEKEKVDLTHQYCIGVNESKQDLSHNNNVTTIWIEPDQKNELKSCTTLNEHSQSTNTTEEKNPADMDPDLLSLAKSLNCYMCIMLFVSFFLMTTITFCQLYFQNF